MSASAFNFELTASNIYFIIQGTRVLLGENARSRLHGMILRVRKVIGGGREQSREREREALHRARYPRREVVRRRWYIHSGL